MDSAISSTQALHRRKRRFVGVHFRRVPTLAHAHAHAHAYQDTSGRHSTPLSKWRPEVVCMGTRRGGSDIVSFPAHFRPPFCNGPKGGLAHLLDILIPPLGRLPKYWQAPPCLAIRNLAASFAHLRESYLGILSNEIKLYPILPLSQF